MRRNKKTVAAAVLSIGFLTSGSAVAQSGSYMPDRAQLERNKAAVMKLFEYDDSLDIEGMRRMQREDYVQHVISTPDRREPLLTMLTTMAKEFAAKGQRLPSHEIVRVLAEGDHVWAYMLLKIPDGTTRVRVCMFRIQDGQIAEHWEVGEAVNERRQNRNDHVAVGRGRQDFTRQPQQVTKILTPQQLEANKNVVRQFYHAKAARDTTALRKIMPKDFIQHDATIEDGREALLAGLDRARAETRLPDGPDELIRMIAEGDYVWVFLRRGGGKAAQFDQFRIENGQLVEHWGLNQDVPERSPANPNDFFGQGRGLAADFTR